jgi:hypothetical protein
MPHAARHHRKPAPVANGRERRLSPRLPASVAPDLKARLLAGAEVRLVDLSRRGVLLETDTRLLPGSPISVRFLTSDAALVMNGCVVRSSVAVVSAGGLVYRTAVAFEEDLALCDASLWGEGEQPPSTADDAAAQLHIVHRRDHDDAAVSQPASGPHPTTVTTVFAASGDDLRALLVANDW